MTSSNLYSVCAGIEEDGCRLLQGSGHPEGCQRGPDQEGIQENGSEIPSRQGINTEYKLYRKLYIV